MSIKQREVNGNVVWDVCVNDHCHGSFYIEAEALAREAAVLAEPPRQKQPCHFSDSLGVSEGGQEESAKQPPGNHKVANGACPECSLWCSGWVINGYHIEPVPNQEPAGPRHSCYEGHCPAWKQEAK